LGGGKLRGDLGDQTGVAGKPKNIVHAVRLAPRHQLLARKAAIRSQHDAHKRPAAADLRDDPRHYLYRTGRAVDVRAPKLGAQNVPPAEHVIPTFVNSDSSGVIAGRDSDNPSL